MRVNTPSSAAFGIRSGSRLDRGRNRLHKRLDVARGLTLGGDRLPGRLNGTATLVAEHHDQLGAQMLDRVLDAANRFVVEHVACNPDDKEIAQTLIEQHFG